MLLATSSPFCTFERGWAGRNRPTASFGRATSLSINSAQDDADPELSADGCTLIFSSNRPGSVGGRDLWEAKVK